MNVNGGKEPIAPMCPAKIINAFEHKGVIWCATGDGLFELNEDERVWERRAHAPEVLLESGPDEVTTLEQVEKNAIERALARYNGNQTKAAFYLGISRSTMYLKIIKYGIKFCFAVE